MAVASAAEQCLQAAQYKHQVVVEAAVLALGAVVQDLQVVDLVPEAADPDLQ